MAELVGSKEIVIHIWLQMAYVMGGENEYMWHDYMCQHYTLVGTLHLL